MTYLIHTNSYRDGSVTFKSQNGEVYYNVSKLSGNCGVAVIYDVIWDIKPGKKEKFFKDFFKHLKTAKDIKALARCKMVMSDYVGGKIDMFCQFFEEEWYEGIRTYNAKSGRKIVVFECDRDPESVSGAIG